jgi:hypothetical protein
MITRRRKNRAPDGYLLTRENDKKQLTLSIGIVKLLIFSCISAAVPQLVRGEVMVFTEELQFFQATSIASTETFDEYPFDSVLGVGAVTIDGVTYASDQPMARWIAGIQIHQVPPRFVSPPNDLGTDLIGTDTLSFGAGATTNAIGFFLLTAGDFTTYNLIVTTADGAQFIDPLVGEPNPAFRGFVASEGIASVTVTHISSVSQINYSFDNVSRGDITEPVPEPASATLFLGFGIFGLLAYCKLRRRRAPPRGSMGSPVFASLQ